jgi:hypothetical protein
MDPQPPMALPLPHYDAAAALLTPAERKAQKAAAEHQALCAYHQQRLQQRLGAAVVELPFYRKHGRWPTTKLERMAAEHLYHRNLDSLRRITP